jgi:cytochrome c nitrite reductase small subunit
VKRAAALTVFFISAALAASETPTGIPRPHGWIGTTLDWARGLGIGFAVLNLILLIVAWQLFRRGGEGPAAKQLLMVSIAVLPIAIVFFAYSYGMEASQEVEACNSCHVMNPYVNDLRNSKSETLAAVHFKNKYIQDQHCYTCHSDYGMFGTVRAKFEGLGHIVRYSTGAYELPLKIAHPYSNLRCLNCHGESQKFLDPEKHPKEDLPAMISGNTSCLECHGPAHPRPAHQAAR